MPLSILLKDYKETLRDNDLSFATLYDDVNTGDLLVTESANNDQDSLLLLDGFTRSSYPTNLSGSTPDGVGAGNYTTSMSGGALARISSAGVLQCQDSGGVEQSPIVNGGYLQFDLGAGVTPYEIGCEFSCPTFAGNSATTLITLVSSSSAAPPSGGTFMHLIVNLTGSASSPTGMSGGVNIWDSSRGYVGVTLLPIGGGVTSGQGYSGASAGPAPVAGRIYRARFVFSGGYTFAAVTDTVTGNVVFTWWGYYDRQSSICGRYGYIQFNAGVSLRYHSLWARTRPEQNTGSYAQIPGGLEGTAIGQVTPASGRFTGYYADWLRTEPAVGAYWDVFSRFNVGTAYYEMPTFRGPTGARGGVRFAGDVNYGFRLSFRTLNGAYEPYIDTNYGGELEIGLNGGAWLRLHDYDGANDFYLSTNQPGMNFSTNGGIVFGTGAPSATNQNGTLYIRNDAGGAGSRIYLRIGGAWVATAA